MMISMTQAVLDEAIELLEKANAGLRPELVAARDARDLLAAYARAERLAAFGIAALTRKLTDVAEIARTTGTSMGKARAVADTGKAMAASPVLAGALQHGEISLDQATEIAVAEQASPGVAKGLVEVAQSHGFHVLRAKARAAKLEAEQHRDLGRRQREARCARSHVDTLGMVHVHLELEPQVGAPIVARAESEAARLARAASAAGSPEPFERHLADAYAALVAGAPKTKSRRPELVVLVSHEVVKRGWTDVRKGEVCKIPGVGPVSPQVARQIAEDAFLSGVFYDGVDLRHFKRWTRAISPEIRVALELGNPPGFDGVACVDCGNRFRTELDHVTPRCAEGPTSHPNLKPRCWRCHRQKTARDLAAARSRGP